MNEISGSHGLFTSFLRRNAAAFCRWTSPALVVVGALFADTATVQAQNSPVGLWDFSVHGDARGAAVIEFFGNGSLVGDRIITSPRKGSDGDSVSDNPRNPGAGPGDPRTGEEGEEDNGGSTSTTNSVGGAVLGGSWTYDNRGNVIGYLQELSVRYNETNDTNFTYITNLISFRAVVKPNKIVLRSYGSGKKYLLQGKPSGPAPDISGSFYATGRNADGPFIEFFTLAPYTTPGSPPNVYELTGTGPGYEISGTAILTRQGDVALVRMREDTRNIMAVAGKFNTRKSTGVLKGGGSEAVKYTITQQ